MLSLKRAAATFVVMMWNQAVLPDWIQALLPSVRAFIGHFGSGIPKSGDHLIRPIG
jgi:hypothetical protein